MITPILPEQLKSLQAIAVFAARVCNAGPPLDDAGFCQHCEVHIIEIGVGSTNRPHAEQCMWELLRMEVEAYQRAYGRLGYDLSKAGK